MSSPVNVGDVLAGKYQVERVLGVGGMGVVVAAKHLALGERVALKFLLPAALARADVVARFLQEGRAAARIRNEHVARVHDVGTLEGGEPYLVMEYLEGNDLGAILRRDGALPIEDAVEYVLQACTALADAHAINIIHRDLKPANLFLTRSSDGSPSIKIIDFGISKVTLPEGDTSGGGEMTQTAVMMGSPLYMAPEQMASARDVDARADIWSLGIILHTLITGTPPFKAQSVMQVYELISLGAPPLRKLRPDAPEGLEAAILACLHKDRRKRFNDVGELADAIAEFGPAHARFTADRVKRIIKQKTSHASLPPLTETPPVAAVTPPSAPSVPSGAGAGAPASKASVGDLKASTDVGAPPSTSTDGTPPPAHLSVSALDRSQPTGASISPDPHATDGPWDQKTRPPTRGRSKVAMIVAAVAAVAIGAPLGFYLLRGTRDVPTAPAPAASSIGSAPSSSLPLPGPTVAPGSAAPDTAVPPPTPSAELVPSASTSAPPRPLAPIRKGPHPAPTQKAHADPFANQHPGGRKN